MRKETQCVHSGSLDDAVHGGVNSPIYTSSAFNYLERSPVSYPRYFNTPNQKAVVEKVCALEGAEDGVLFSSGMAAISTSLLAFAGTGDHVVMMDELYGGTHAFATDQFQRLGISCTFTATDADAICAAVTDRTRVVVVESPTNPLLSVIDIRKVGAFCSGRGIVSIIDNTFATPLFQNPLGLGIDVVVHSGTKYLGGHSDICCGIAVTSKEHATRIRKLGLSLGGSMNAQTCALLERSLKTLAIRVERQTENAGHIARFLQAHEKVTRVNYPGLPDFRNHALAKSQMSGFGPMLSFELDAAGANSNRFVRALKIIKPAVSLGGIESTICAPAVTSHAKMSAEERARIGVSDSLLRLSVGIEQKDDLIGDLEQALKG
ncbi:MAG TPA: aminotransferase class I/II-fold pyridoxal phosphate-dependent enzyme [Nitrospirota bacterium]|nr:aminotransferase class I/II-fold pyridoxal phosphate-dependent enzyme [Nitrospirota bacterium]